MRESATNDRVSSLTESRRRIITFLRKHGSLTKRDLTKQGHMSWATAVKAIDQLSDDAIVRNVGMSSRDSGRRGKTAYLYALSSERPLAIGIDVEYSTTVVLTDLAGEVIRSKTHKNPQQADDATAKEFLAFVIRNFTLEHHLHSEELDGVGIGFPSSSIRDNIRKAQMLEGHLADVFQMRIRVETNTKAYAVFSTPGKIPPTRIQKTHPTVDSPPLRPLSSCYFSPRYRPPLPSSRQICGLSSLESIRCREASAVSRTMSLQRSRNDAAGGGLILGGSWCVSPAGDHQRADRSAIH